MQFWENFGECKKTQRYQTCSNQEPMTYLVSEPNYHATKLFSENSVLEMKNIYTHKKSVYLGLQILKITKIAMYEFWYNDLKPKHRGKGNIVLHKYKQFYSLHEHRRHLRKHCKRC